MRLGFYYHIPAVSQNGHIYLPGYLGRFLDYLAEHLDEMRLFLHSPDPDKDANLDYCIQSSQITLISLEPRGSVPNRMLHPRKYTQPIKENLENLDAVLIRGPSPLLPAIHEAVKGTAVILLLVGDYLAGVDSSAQPSWRKELIRLWSRYNTWGELKAARNSLTFVNSRALYRQFEGKTARLIETRTTTLAANDFYDREDTCQNRPVHLLYTGRMDPAKGLLDMVQALNLLVEQGEDVVLDLVGWGEKKASIMDDILRLAEEKKISERVHFHGYKPVGPELFAFYQQSDIYLIASQSSFEGFPRTIWEAMAHSLPVVATRVGSIPDFIEGAAELVEPNRPNRLGEGIARVIHDPVMRREFITRGLKLARANTLESQAAVILSNIEAWVREVRQ